MATARKSVQTTDAKIKKKIRETQGKGEASIKPTELTYLSAAVALLLFNHSHVQMITIMLPLPAMPPMTTLHKHTYASCVYSKALSKLDSAIAGKARRIAQPCNLELCAFGSHTAYSRQ